MSKLLGKKKMGPAPFSLEHNVVATVSRLKPSAEGPGARVKCSMVGRQLWVLGGVLLTLGLGLSSSAPPPSSSRPLLEIFSQGARRYSMGHKRAERRFSMGAHAASYALTVILLLLFRVSLASSNNKLLTSGNLDHEELEWLRRQDKIKYKLKVKKGSSNTNLAQPQASFSMEAFRGLFSTLNLPVPRACFTFDPMLHKASKELGQNREMLPDTQQQ